jgi:hypothetical protein
MAMSDYVRPPLRGMQPEAQSLSSLCWYTCFRMLYRWNGRDTGTILDKLSGAGIDIEDARQTGLKLKDNLKAAKALEMNCLGFGQPVTVYNLKEVLKHSPVWVTGRWNPASNHVVVLTAASDQWVEYFDPWWVGTPEDVNSVKKRQTDWFLHGDRKECHGLAHTFQWYPLIYWKQ